MERARKGKAPKQVEGWEKHKAEAGDAVVDLAQAMAGTVFARTVGKECRIN
jgi:hypothetical protein